MYKRYYIGESGIDYNALYDILYIEGVKMKERKPEVVAMAERKLKRKKE